MKIIIAGSRTFGDYSFLSGVMDKYIADGCKCMEIVSGGARGADALGERWAKEHSFRLTVFKADWNKYGRSAGYKRNMRMAQYADMLVAFWDGLSTGTKHMIDVMEYFDKPCCVYNYYNGGTS